MNPPDHIQAALLAFLEGDPEPEQLALLESALAGDAALRRELSSQLGMESLLRQYAEPAGDSFVRSVQCRMAAGAGEDEFVAGLREVLLAQPDASPAPSAPSSWPGRRPVFLTRRFKAVAALAALLAVAWSAWHFTAPRGTPEIEEPLATARFESGAVFASEAAPREGVFDAGRYDLRAGEMVLRMRSGVVMSVRAPARWRFVSAMQVELELGAARFAVPEQARGFAVHSGGAEFEDLGTEFGVSAEPESGRSSARVFVGEVNVREPGSQRLMASLTSGQSVAVSGGRTLDAPAPPAAAFPSADDIALARWSSRATALAADPSLLAYFPLRPGGAPGETLPNAAASGIASPARITGAARVTGRWPGKPALQFENPGDAVRFHLPGRYTDLTFSLWMKLDRAEHPWTHVLGSARFDLHSVHLSMHGSSLPHLSSQAIMGRGTKTTSVRFPHLNQWMHVALVVDSATRETRLCINGQRSSVRTWVRPDWIFEPREMSLGCFDEGDDPREFRGRIDELAIWSRALSDEEIQSLATLPQP